MKKIIMMMMMMIIVIGLIGRVVSAKEGEAEDLVEKTCKNTPHFDLCLKVLTADPTSKTADVPALGLIVVAEIKKKTQEIMASIQKTAGKTKLMKAALTECHNKYNAVMVGDVPVAESAMRGNPKFAETAVADVKIEALGCEQAFKGVAPSPFTKENNYIADLADVARGIVRNLL